MAQGQTKFQGYLEKQSFYIKRFRKRWIVLKHRYDTLYCYKTQEMKNKATEIIDLKQFKTIKTNNIDRFILVHCDMQGENRVFRSDDKSALNKWMIIIAKIIRHNNAIKQGKKDGIISHDGTYQHRVDKQEINCPNMIKTATNNPSDCAIYYNVKEKYQFHQENLDHLLQYRHHEKEYDDKPICKYGDECKSYIRCESGVDQNKIKDQCHMLLYRHPPRTRQIKLAENIHSLVINKSPIENRASYYPIYEQVKVWI